MFDKQITEFNESLLSLTDFIELIEPVLLEKNKEHLQKMEPFLLLGLLNKLSKEAEDGDEEKLATYVKAKGKIMMDLQKKYPGVINVELDTLTDEKDAINIKGLYIQANKDLEESGAIDELVIKHRNHLDQLYRNAFISLISNIEWFFSQILHKYYSSYPERALLDKKQLTFKDLNSFDTISDARQFLIEEKIEAILRDKVELWFDTLKQDLHLGLGYYQPYKNSINEIFQRRNLIIHNGGIINSIYLNKVPKSIRGDLKLFDSIYIDKEYLNKSIEILQLNFLLIAFELWKKQDLDDIERGDLLNTIIYENVKNSRWEIALNLSQFLIHDKKMPNENIIVAQFNYWLCKKRLGQNKEVQSEIKDIDFTDRKTLYQLVLETLKDNFKSAIRLLEVVLKNKELSIKDLEEFPIFEELRSSTEFLSFKTTCPHFPQDSPKRKPRAKKEKIIIPTPKN